MQNYDILTRDYTIIITSAITPSMVEQKILQQCQVKQLAHHKHDGRMVIVRIRAAHDHFKNINFSHFKREPAENNHVSEIVVKEGLAVTIDDTDITPNMAAFNNG